MRLYLSSYRLGDRFDELVAAAGAGARAAVIANAVDLIPIEDRLAYARTGFDPVGRFRTHGLDADELDLRAFFGKPAALAAALADVRLVWANGGNAFLLRRAMRQSGLDEILKRRVPAGELIYGGWSAGAVVRDTRRVYVVVIPGSLSFDGLNDVSLTISWPGAGRPYGPECGPVLDEVR